jgi:hypothetical protein
VKDVVSVMGWWVGFAEEEEVPTLRAMAAGWVVRKAKGLGGASCWWASPAEWPASAPVVEGCVWPSATGSRDLSCAISCALRVDSRRSEAWSFWVSRSLRR